MVGNIYTTEWWVYIYRTGWGDHMICNKKYHFLIPSKLEKWKNEIGKSWWWDFVELKTHLMHGVFHSNGFGHLLSLNALQPGPGPGPGPDSDSLSGHQIMDLWDRLCTGLRARKISLNDTSQKRGMELRLLHGVAQSESWFGRWGYKFGRGTYGITQPVYQKAIEAIQGIPLTLITTHLVANVTDHYNIISTIFLRYQNISEHSLLTLRNLFEFMLDLKSRLLRENQPANSINPISIMGESNNCRWSPKRVEMATRVIIEALKTTRFKWVSRQEVRDAARTYIGDTGLLDFVLKSLGNQIVGSYLVRRSLNPVTKVLEYCLEDISNVFNNLNTYYQEGSLVIKNNSSSIKNHKKMNKITKCQLVKDLLYLYKYVLKDEMSILSNGLFNAIPVASRIILDTKYFVKEYFTDMNNYTKDQEGKIKLFCTVTIKNDDHDDINNNNYNYNYNYINNNPHCEGIVIKKDATVRDLNFEVEKCFREIYWGLRSFVVKSVMGLNEIRGFDRLVIESVQMGREIVFEGTINRDVTKDGVNGHDIGVYVEGGLKNMINIVDCRCGAKDDDGERMVSCDICEVWQHTRCVCIPNNEEIPHIFLCNRCEQEIVPLASLP